MIASSDQQAKIEQAVAILQKARYGIAFTGAGISVESGIPPFRGKDGIWSKVDPNHRYFSAGKSCRNHTIDG